MTKCFEPDSIDLIKPPAVDEGDDDDDDMDILIPHNISVTSPYRPVQVMQKDLDNRTNRKLDHKYDIKIFKAYYWRPD